MHKACAEQRVGAGRCVRRAVGAGHMAARLQGFLGSLAAGRWCGRWRARRRSGAACCGRRSCKGGCMLSAQDTYADKLAAI